ncbi:hypothetical protein Taro_016495 [Colocasia esculenta]|uniref:Uncharacterized protein n=1 Tax=Colocasia esculenta TaxID=4460 RepID=A0A843UNY2_COLES|nr:hypothetical protein [Colocasia esculenta]
MTNAAGEPASEAVVAGVSAGEGDANLAVTAPSLPLPIANGPPPVPISAEAHGPSLDPSTVAHAVASTCETVCNQHGLQVQKDGQVENFSSRMVDVANPITVQVNTPMSFAQVVRQPPPTQGKAALGVSSISPSCGSSSGRRISRPSRKGGVRICLPSTQERSSSPLRSIDAINTPVLPPSSDLRMRASFVADLAKAENIFMPDFQFDQEISEMESDEENMERCSRRPVLRPRAILRRTHSWDRSSLEVRLLDYTGCPGNRVRVSPSSVTCPIPFSKVESHHPVAEEVAQPAGRQPCWISGGKIDPGPASRYITSLLHAHVPGPVDSSKEFPLSVRDLLFDMFTQRYMFMRPKDLPRARAVWESTAQTNFRKSMWEARDKAVKIIGSQDPTTWMDYGPVWMRRDYWKSLCHRWATGPWQEMSQAAKRNLATHPEKNVHTSRSVSYATHNQKLRHELERPLTSCELFDWTHKRKGTDDYVSESACMITETYDRTMADRYEEGTPQPDLDPEAWVDVAGGLRKGRVYGFGDSLDTTLVLSSYASSVAPPAYASSSVATLGSDGDDIRTLIWEELSQQLPLHLGAMVEQLVAAIRGAGTSLQAPQFE